MANILRIIIVLVFFIMGAIVGHIYIPQKNFDQKSIVVPQRPKTSVNLENVPPAETVLKQAENYKNFLIASGQDQEEIIGFENNFKRTVLQLYYKEAAANYALELLKIQTQPDHTTPYIKARDHYKKLIDLIETLYPLEEPKEVLVIKDETPLPALLPASATSTQTVTSSQTIQSEVKTVSSATK